MNWTKGMFRLWVVGSAVWVVIAPVAVIDDIRGRHPANEFADLIPLSADNIAQIAFTTIMPPLAAIAAFLILRWIWRGFRA